jgi:2-amino-4-hydroxy-6-hydroxymethyldihydropteridine diphosphokinase
MKRVFLSFGSNLGNRIQNIEKALDLLPKAGVEIRRVSSFYKTEPVGVGTQPWFVNCVAQVSTKLTPRQLLKTLKSVERALGRRRSAVKGPRPIDIDILLYENVVVRSSVLTIPHERLGERRFVLVPLRELAAHTRHPVTQRTVREMLHDTMDRSKVIRMKADL